MSTSFKLNELFFEALTKVDPNFAFDYNWTENSLWLDDTISKEKFEKVLTLFLQKVKQND